ncbi:hypothetical protein OQA88_1451 [Cercophora sp. LCS_1]
MASSTPPEVERVAQSRPDEHEEEKVQQKRPRDEESVSDSASDTDSSPAEAVPTTGDGGGGVLTAVLSRIVSRASIKSVGPPPDGGFKAWMTVACAHLVVMNTWGFINSFGVFQTYYASSLGRAPADISWIGKKKMLAIGIVACGSATGGLIFPSMARQLLERVGFGWTIRAIGLVQAVTGVVCVVGLKPRIRPRSGGEWFDLEAWKEGEYVFYTAGAFMMFLGVYFGFYYIASFSREVIGISYVDSLNLLLVLNGVGSVGRLIPNYFADRYGPITIMIPTATIAGVCVLCWTAVDSVAGLYVWCVFYGMAAGGIQSLFPAGLSSLATDLRKAGIRLGMAFSIVSFATLIGPPVAGAIITATGGSYRGAQIFAGVCLLVGAVCMFFAKLTRVRRVKGDYWRTKV